MPRILVTGGAGYIGTHTIIELLSAGFEVVCLDNLSNSSPEALARVERITRQPVPFEIGDIRDAKLLASVFARHKIDGVIHFAALKAVGESVAKPLAYYDNNISGTLALLQAMNAAGVSRIVFSSSATVYGAPDTLPITENAAIRTTNPYGATKAMNEQILRDLCAAQPEVGVVALRYFNPVGAHDSGLIGEDPTGIPNNLFPFITQVAVGKRPHVSVFGNDWPTVDGTGVRDYIHVVDLAIGHVKAMQYALDHTGFVAPNFGTGQGTSVLQLIQAFEAASGVPVPYQIAPRRPGDIAACWADVSLAEKLFGWRAQRTVAQMCADGWRWQKQNPNGFRTT
ncbi:MAG: UDP-glucose 4-epimerase GalE [Burkholderiaceae bacterium]